MKVIEFTKSFRNGIVTHRIVVEDVISSDDMINDMAENWAEGESSGQNYGYKLSWKEITDLQTIMNTVDEVINKTTESIKRLEHRRIELDKFQHQTFLKLKASL